MKKDKTQKPNSMRTSLVRLVVLCWIIPVVAITFLLSFVITRNITAGTTQNAANSVYAAAKICMGKIDGAISSSRYASYNTTISSAYNSFRRDEDYVQLYQSIDIFLAGNYKFDSDFMFTYLRFYDSKDTNLLSGKEFYVFNEALFPESRQETGRSAYSKFLKEDSAKIIADAKNFGTSIGFVNINEKLYLVRNLYLNGSEPTAMLVMRLNTGGWFDTILQTPWSDGVVLSLGGERIAVLGENISLSNLGISADSIAPDKTHVLRKDDYLYLYGQCVENDYTFGYLVSANEPTLHSESSFLQMVLLLSSLAAVPLLIFVLLYFHSNVNKPIKVLVAGADEINKGNLGYQVDFKAADAEFINLTNSFNEMSGKLKMQFEQIFREELALRDAKIMALQLQINPHFLGNTLEIINWEARLGNNTKVTKMIESLSTMLDGALDRNKMPIIHLSEEMMYVDAYLYIISERFSKRLTIERDIDETLLDTYVPRLILQPLIENAVEHGISPIQHGTIKIIIRRLNDKLCMEIENNGQLTAADEEKIRTILSNEAKDSELGSAHLGIKNVSERIRIIYGRESSFSINMPNHSKVLTQIIIPFEQNNK